MSSNSTRKLQLFALPEELLQRILAPSVVANLYVPRPSWYRVPGSTTIRGRLAPLLVCKLFRRICTPLFYHTVHIASPAQLHLLLTNALRHHPFLATYTRCLILAGIWAEGGELLSLCGPSLRLLDITLDVTQLAPRRDGELRDWDAKDFCEGLKDITFLTHLSIRKPGNVYLTHSKPKYVLTEVARAMAAWDDLEMVDLAFRMSDDSGCSTNLGSNPGPITSLTHALSTRPKLHTVCTALPSMWNEALLRVSVNPSLERIVLGDSRGWTNYPPGNPYPTSTPQNDKYGILGTGLFLTQAKKHPRLSELIKAGTSIMRSRAYTMDSPASPVFECLGPTSRPPPPSHYPRSPSLHPNPGPMTGPIRRTQNHRPAQSLGRPFDFNESSSSTSSSLRNGSPVTPTFS